ncbi:MAG: T9SS type A sorting domain-containing protein [Bacteroidia bacterium]|nr:T9SS type A sorting domain-containing protein [Bacteroidia bacterium]
MKKIYLSLFSLVLSFAAMAQCTPDASVTKPGISPFKLPDGVTGQPYSQVVTLMVPRDSSIMYQGNMYNVVIDSASVVSISDLPTGFGYEANKASRTWNGGERGCARLFGNPIASSVGDYVVKVKVRTFFKIVGLATPLDQLDSSTIDFRVVMGSSLNEINQAHKLVAYPNPAKEELNIELPIYSKQTSFSVFNLMGQNMNINSEISSQTNEVKFNISNLPSGIYMVYGLSDNKPYQARFIKE